MSEVTWTTRQLVALENMAGVLSIPELTAELNARGPEHSERSVVQRASVEGVSLARRGRTIPWDDKQDAVLRECAGFMASAEIGREVRRRCDVVRSAKAVHNRAARLGLALNEPRTLALGELRNILPVDRERIRWWVATGMLAAERACARLWRFGEAEVERFMRTYPWEYDWRGVRGERWQRIAREVSVRNAWLTAEQAAVALRRDASTVRRLAERGEFPGAQLVAKRWRIPGEAVVERIRGSVGGFRASAAVDAAHAERNASRYALRARPTRANRQWHARGPVHRGRPGGEAGVGPE